MAALLPTSSMLAWARYAHGLGLLAAMFLPRAARWGRRWAQAQVDARLPLARPIAGSAR